jgi:hypothetical protein
LLTNALPCSNAGEGIVQPILKNMEPAVPPPPPLKIAPVSGAFFLPEILDVRISFAA